MKNYEESIIENYIQFFEGLENFSSVNVCDVKKSVRNMRLDEAEDETVRSYLACLKRVAPLIDFDLRDASRADIEDLALVINEEDSKKYGKNDGGSYSAWTRADDKASLQTFFRYINSDKKDRLFQNIRLTPKTSDRPKLDAEQLIKPTEAEALIGEVEHPRDRAFLGLLWDSGMRRKEIASLRWKDIVPMEDGILKIHVREGKNGPRPVFLYESVPLVDAWFSSFPDVRPDDSLWISKKSKKKKEVGYRALDGIVEKAREGARIPSRRKTNLHAWRKARATDMAAKGMNQPAMERYFGWCRGSRMPRIYIQLAEVDLENQVRDIYGLERKRKQQKFIGENLKEYQDRGDVKIRA